MFWDDPDAMALTQLEDVGGGEQGTLLVGDILEKLPAGDWTTSETRVGRGGWRTDLWQA